jgi:hypothetical protein
MSPFNAIKIFKTILKILFSITIINTIFYLYLLKSKQTPERKSNRKFYFYDNTFAHLISNSSLKVSDFINFKNCTLRNATKNSRPRILCTVFTHEKNLNTKALAVNRTWGTACDTLLFVTSDHCQNLNNKPKLNYAFLRNFTENYSKLTIKTIKAILYVYANHKMDYDWMLKADDDTFVIVDNLRKLLREKCTDEPHNYGYRFENDTINSGGAGYVLNSHTVNSFVHAYYTNETFCKHDLWGLEDVDIAWCLRQIGVTPGDSRDSSGLERFHSNTHDFKKHEAKSKNQVKPRKHQILKF